MQAFSIFLLEHPEVMNGCPLSTALLSACSLIPKFTSLPPSSKSILSALLMALFTRYLASCTRLYFPIGGWGQFSESAGKDCQRCHSTPADWTAPGFDHDRDSRFPLDGDHDDVPCASCHPTLPHPDGSTFVQYRPLGRECQDCHERPDR